MDRDAGRTVHSNNPAKSAAEKIKRKKFRSTHEGGGSKDWEVDAAHFFEENHKRIDELCAQRWPYIEKEDREQEAMLVLMIALRNLRLDDGYFWRDYETLLNQHMEERKESMSSLFRYHCRSLDAQIQTRIPGKTCALLDCLSSTSAW